MRVRRELANNQISPLKKAVFKNHKYSIAKISQTRSPSPLKVLAGNNSPAISTRRK
jgi:hypothetical protein